jgi:hypothetical protein
MKYFPLHYRLQGQERYLIWITNENDSVAVDSNGSVPSFRDLAEPSKYSDSRNYRLETDEPVLHDLDWVKTWITSPIAKVDCEEALNTWNLFRDVAASFPNKVAALEELDSDLPIYDKLFWGNNLPAVTPPGERYVPEWSPEEIHC